MADGDACGVTVGKKPPSPGGVIVALGIGWNVVGGSGGTGGPRIDPPTGGCVLVLVTTVVTAASAGESGEASAVTVRVIAAPAVAACRT